MRGAWLAGTEVVEGRPIRMLEYCAREVEGCGPGGVVNDEGGATN